MGKRREEYAGAGHRFGEETGGSKRVPTSSIQDTSLTPTGDKMERGDRIVRATRGRQGWQPAKILGSACYGVMPVKLGGDELAALRRRAEGLGGLPARVEAEGRQPKEVESSEEDKSKKKEEEEKEEN